MAITAETRTAIVQLVVTAYDAAPGTTLLTELVALVDDGGSLADVAANLTTRTEWTSKYPSFQTAGEFGAEWLGALVPEASADALAAGVVSSRRLDRWWLHFCRHHYCSPGLSSCSTYN